MPAPITESQVEAAALAWFEELGYGIAYGPDIGPEGRRPERASYGAVPLEGRLKAAIDRLNPDIPAEARADALRKILQSETPSLLEENRRLHRLLTEGVPVEFRRDDGTIGAASVRLADFIDPGANDWLAVNQYTVIERGKQTGHSKIGSRRPDIVVFLNGLPLGIVELKNAADENATLDDAFNQLQTYKTDVPSLFRTNAVLAISDGLEARIGSLTADRERFMPWRTIDGTDVAPKGTPELPVLIQGVFEKTRFLDLLQGFTVFEGDGASVAKKIAGYHQFHAVRRAVACTIEASQPGGSRKVGVIWHTQGSGKSLLMAFYAGQVARHPDMKNPTLVVITDRNDLDDQLFTTFSVCRDLLRQTPQQARDRAHLRELLSRTSGGVIFTTIQKFTPDKGEELYPKISDRTNIVVMADEAHRSQYGFRARIDGNSGEIGYGFAKYLRDALPYASFIGFTGTPIEEGDRSTPAVFGEYIDVYDIHRAVEDGATVPIYYEGRLARITLDPAERPTLDAEFEEITEAEEENERARIAGRWARVEALVGAPKRLALIAEDLIRHFEARQQAIAGKAMIVCMSRRICVALYDAIIRLRPAWHSPEDDKGVIKIVMTGSAADPGDWQPHIGNKARREFLAKRFKDANDPLKLVIVRDMWLTGFDVPSMHTMYVDKPMKGHGLMQAIARVNRVFRDKPGGLVVDYIGLADTLQRALASYTDPRDRAQTGIPTDQAIAALEEKLEVVRAMFYGFDYRPGLTGTAAQRLATLAAAIEHVLEMESPETARAATEDERRTARRRFIDAVVALSKAFALAAATDEAARVREEVGFFQMVRAALTKTGAGGGRRGREIDLAVQQIVSKAVISTEIVDILKAAGLRSPDISILSEEFLAEIKGAKQKNLALEALRKLLNDEIRARTRTNVAQAKSFSQRLEEAVAKYHNRAITTAQLLEELIALAHDLRAAQSRGENLGLNAEEVAFYDALATNKSAREVMGDDKLRIIAAELVINVKSNVSVDWAQRETARARMRVLVKRILSKWGYPPDLQAVAVQTVLEQAEVLSAEWAI